MCDCRDENYYLSFVVFKVEDCLFRVPREGFEEQSDVFKTMFTLPSGGAAELDGCSDDHPVLLEGISVDDFRTFLKVLYPRPFRSRTPFEDKPLSEEELRAVLGLARMWCFDDIARFAIAGLEALRLAPAHRLALAREYDVAQWVKPGLRALALREETLSAAEAEQLGPEHTLAVARLRDERYRTLTGQSSQCKSGTCGCYKAGWELEREFRYLIEQQVDKKLDELA
ncbi:hypothetical protein DFH11DRAFT_1579276 [Phellopilus nigrolimitatus]|nr:hypothetical protein DFH11DRAFT_1579276 [Phellopilus nigrolimitatus]